MDLTRWGWSPELQHAFDHVEGSRLEPGRIVRHDRTGYLVVHGGGEAFARLAGHLRREPPAAGDWVALDPAEPATIRALLPRRTTIARAAPGRAARAQVVAANMDVLFVVAGLDTPLRERRIERYLALAAASGVRAVVVLNKADVAEGVSDQVPGRATGVPGDHVTIVTSARTGAGLLALRALVPPGTTAAFVGPSGVGKSSLVNALLQREALPTSPVREADGKGRHTTSARQLVPVPGGGVVLDTPGMRELGLWDAEGGVAAVFADIDELSARCRFRDCAHDSEPGCAVREGVSPDRLAAWRKLQREAESVARRANVAKARADARAWGKMARGATQAKRERYR